MIRVARRCTREAQDLTQLWKRVAQQPFSGLGLRPHEIHMRRLKNMIRRARAGRGAFYVIQDNDHVAGFVCGFQRPQAAWRHTLTDVTIAVDAPYQRRGYGRRLMNALMHDVMTHRSHDIARIELSVFSFNTPAITMYRRLGFQCEGVRILQCVNQQGERANVEEYAWHNPCFGS